MSDDELVAMVRDDKLVRRLLSAFARASDASRVGLVAHVERITRGVVLCGGAGGDDGRRR